MRRCWMFGALAFLSCTMLQPAASYAHHNQFQGFDPAKEQVVTGTVERFAWQNPHAYIYVASGEGNEARFASGVRGPALRQVSLMDTSWSWVSCGVPHHGTGKRTPIRSGHANDDFAVLEKDELVSGRPDPFQDSEV